MVVRLNSTKNQGVSCEAVLKTNFGKLTILEVAELVELNKKDPSRHWAVHVLSYTAGKDPKKLGQGVFKRILTMSVIANSTTVIEITTETQQIAVNHTQLVLTDVGLKEARSVTQGDKMIQSIANGEMDCARWAEVQHLSKQFSGPKMYSLSIDETACFFANNLLVKAFNEPVEEQTK